MSFRGRQEFVPADRAVWQSDDAKTYRCDDCERPVFTQHTGAGYPLIWCRGVDGHLVVWCRDNRVTHDDPDNSGLCIHCAAVLDQDPWTVL